MSLLKKEPGQPEAEATKRKRCPELSAMGRIDAILADLTPEVKKRVLGWIVEKHVPRPTIQQTLADLLPPGWAGGTGRGGRMTPQDLSTGPAMVNGSTTGIGQ